MSLGQPRRSMGTNANHRHASDADRAHERERLRSRVRDDVVPDLEALADPSAAARDLIALADRASRRLRSQIEPRHGDDALFGLAGVTDPTCVDEREWVRHHLHDTALNTLEYIASDGMGEGLEPSKIASLAAMVAHDLRTWVQSDASPVESDASPAEPELLPELMIVTEQARRLDARVELVAEDEVRAPLCGEEIEALAGAVREAINNARKHAHATNVVVRVECLGAGRTAVTITDDGIGIDLELAEDGAGLGVKGSIVGRMQRVGGYASLKGTPGGGTRVTLVTRQED